MKISARLKSLKKKLSSKRFGKARKVIVTIVGGLLVLIGIILIFIPGPAFVVIPAGLALLATEFEWARKLLKKFREWLHKIREKYRAMRGKKPAKAAK